LVIKSEADQKGILQTTVMDNFQALLKEYGTKSWNFFFLTFENLKLKFLASFGWTLLNLIFSCRLEEVFSTPNPQSGLLKALTKLTVCYGPNIKSTVNVPFVEFIFSDSRLELELKIDVTQIDEPKLGSWSLIGKLAEGFANIENRAALAAQRQREAEELKRLEDEHKRKLVR